ncbi:Transcription elongation factor spt6 [Tulasnella sp. 427]|nr:Transcription elongation factor spt6 [Tulasnella sp. 427]
MDIQTGDAHTRRIPLDECYDKVLMERNKDIADRKKRREVDQIRRIIKHPNFHNLNYKQAEELLSHQQRGDVVIRPSTKGPDHLAVTWKVDNGLYQHIDVVEPNADITSQNVGTHLVVEGKYQFSDLDELIVNHVKAMARRVEELMVHEKFMKGTDSEIHVELDQKIRGMRNQRSVYAFGLNRDRPGWFKLHFKANTMSPIQMMLVKVTPNGYQLDGQEFGSVSDLCDGFKTKVGRMGGVAGAQTPYGSARTPAMTPGRGAGGTTPGHMSSRQTPGHASSRLNPNMGKTPNPYAASAAKTPNPYAPPGPGGGGGRPPVPTSAPGAGWGAPPGGSSWGAPSSNAGGWGQSPAPQRGGPQPPPSGGGTPAGMHPSRVARLNAANSHGNDWGSNRF